MIIWACLGVGTIQPSKATRIAEDSLLSFQHGKAFCSHCCSVPSALMVSDLRLAQEVGIFVSASFPKLAGGRCTFLGGHLNKDYSILGSILGSPTKYVSGFQV